MKKFTDNTIIDNKEMGLIEALIKKLHISYEGEIDDVIYSNISITETTEFKEYLELIILQEKMILLEEIYYDGFKKVYEKYNG